LATITTPTMNILITGASKGLGLQIAKTLLKEDKTIYAISRSEGDLVNLKNEYPGKVHFLAYDLSDAESIKETIFKNWLGEIQLHGFVNNAAMAYDTLLTNMNLEKVQKMTTVNQITPMIMTKHLIRNMILNDTKGSIVHISSVSVHTGYKGLSMYAATKGALEAFSKNTAREWGTKGVRSNCIAAGFMETNMTDIMSEEVKQRIYKRTALKSETSLESVAEMSAFLLSEKAGSITGQVMHVDSGTI